MVQIQVGLVACPLYNIWLISLEVAGSKMLKQMASNDALSTQASSSHLQDFIVKNPSQKGAPGEETLASTIEALIGAVWFDCGGSSESVEEVMETLNLFHNQ